MIQQNKFDLIWSWILKVMIFTILRNFYGIFLNLFRFIFDFYLIKSIKILQKGGNFRASPRGCDVVLRATWLCQVAARERLRGAEVTHRRIIYI